MARLSFDEDVLSQLETLYRTRDILRRRRLVREAPGAARGERIVDVGCGPGFYTAEILDEVGPHGSVVGIDGSAQMLSAAARRCRGHDNVEFLEADVAELPLEDGGCDAGLCVQVLEYVDDPTAPLAEMHRVLRAGGRLVVWDVDWSTVSIHSAVPARAERVLRAWDGHLAHPALPRTLTARLRAAGFHDVRMEGHAFVTADFTPDAYGVSTLPLIERYVVGQSRTATDDVRSWMTEMRELGERGEFFFACIQFCFVATRHE